VQRFQQFIGKAATCKTAAQDHRTIMNGEHGVGSRGQDFVDHRGPASIWWEHARKQQVVI
jgi:hypothetical protein